MKQIGENIEKVIRCSQSRKQKELEVLFDGKTNSLKEKRQYNLIIPH